MKEIPIAAFLALGFVASPGFAQVTELDMEEVMEKESRPRPDLLAVPLPFLDSDPLDAEMLWHLLTSSDTPYLEQRALALRCGERLPLELVPRLIASLEELEAEQERHNFGFYAHPLWARAIGPHQPTEPRRRTILGREWFLPESPSAYPLTWEEEAAAPWPWRVHQALRATFFAAAPRGVVSGEPNPRAQRWLEMAMEMPVGTDAEARHFTSAALACTHHKTLEVLARLRAIALDERFSSSAYRIADRIGDASRLWNDPQGRLACRVVVEDLLRLAPEERTRRQAAYQLRELRERIPNNPEGPDPIPAGAILAAGELALDPTAGDEWTRLYVYAFSIAEALDEAPFPLDRRMDPGSPAVGEALLAFRLWFEAERPDLAALAREQDLELEPLRRRLEALAR